MVAAVPLNDTESWLGVELNPLPLIVTVVPTGPLDGVKPMIDVWEEAYSFVDWRFPTVS
jgi:hypothetical protein